MAKQDQIQAALDALIAAEQQAKVDALNTVWDAGMASVDVGDIAAAVAAAVAPLNEQIATLTAHAAVDEALIAEAKTAVDELDAKLEAHVAPTT